MSKSPVIAELKESISLLCLACWIKTGSWYDDEREEIALLKDERDRLRTLLDLET